MMVTDDPAALDECAQALEREARALRKRGHIRDSEDRATRADRLRKRAADLRKTRRDGVRFG